MKIDPERLSSLRKKKGLTQAQLARMSKINPRTIRRLEKEPSRCEETREDTLARLAEALGVEPGVLTGELPNSTSGKEPHAESGRVRISAQVSPKTRLAYDLVRRRYGVSATEIINIAPLLFALLAEGSLKWRREKLTEVDEAIGRIENPSALLDLGELIEREEWSLDNADVLGVQREEHITGHLLPYNPFAQYLHELDRLAVGDDPVHSSRMRIHYRICAEELSWITNGSMRARMCLETGHARVSEIPDELMAEGAGEERARWLEERMPKDFKEGEWLFGVGPREEGADQ